MAHPKYLAIYNGLPYPADSLTDLAYKLCGMQILYDHDKSAWSVVINGKVSVRYSDEWSHDEIVRDYMKTFVHKNTYANLSFYSLMT